MTQHRTCLKQGVPLSARGNKPLFLPAQCKQERYTLRNGRNVRDLPVLLRNFFQAICKLSPCERRGPHVRPTMMSAPACQRLARESSREEQLFRELNVKALNVRADNQKQFDRPEEVISR